MYRVPIVAPRPSPLARFSQGLNQGLQLSNALQQMAQRRRQQQFAEQLQPLKMQQMQAELALTQEKPNILQQQLAQAQERLDIQNRVNSPEEIASKRAYRDTLQQTLPVRYTSAMGKGIMEQENLSHGMDPAGRVADPNLLSPEKRQQLINQYDLKRIKETTDAKLRNAMVQAQSIDSTISSIPFKSFSKFYGPHGRALAAQEAANVAAGNPPSPEYQEYLNFYNVKGPGLVSQMRQFLQDSVTAGAQDKLKKIVFPDKWLANPGTAENQFEALVDLYNIEKRARQTAFNDPHIFTGTSASKAAAPATGALPESALSAPTGRIKVRAPDGSIGTISAANLDEAMREGYKRI